MNHLDDDAELYALGLTERERDAEIEAHLATCGACRARVVAAEAAAASLAATLPAAPAAPSIASATSRDSSARRAWLPTLAAAAAVVFGVTAAAEGFVAQSASARVARTDVALTAISTSHFGHTTLASAPGVIAKAIYARDGSWCYVVVSGAPRGAHVVLRRGANANDAGALDSGTPATLFVRDAGRPDEIGIVAGGAVVAHGKPAF